VFDVAKKAIDSGSPPKEVLEGLVCTTRLCAATGSGRCSHPNASRSRATCTALAEHFEIALSTMACTLSPRSYPSPASKALDSIELPLIVCDNELRLKHANRTGQLEIESGHWVGLHEGRVVLKATYLAQTLEKLIATLRAPSAPDRLHFSLSQSDGIAAELWLRRLLRGGDEPGLILISIVPQRQTALKSSEQEAAEATQNRLNNLPITARQRELARHLLAGLNLTQAAEQMGISRATANGHLKGLFELSRTRRQSDLIGWLSLNLLG
jgi:DNA-binding CsgD family transcriptional regulator